MNLKQQLIEKNNFLRKAYEVAYEHAPSSPLSVSLDPREFGKSIGYDEPKTTRIMTELISDGYVTSSLGMGMLMVTNLGVDYLREIEDEPMTADLDNTNSISSENVKTQTAFMKQSEKLDLILRELYKYKNDGKYYSIGWICQTLNIPTDSILELNKIAHRLKDDSYINTIFSHNDCQAELTTYGIDYCEEDSYSYSGSAIINNNYHINVENSSDTTIVSQSENIQIGKAEIKSGLNEITDSVNSDSDIPENSKKDLLSRIEKLISKL